MKRIAVVKVFDSRLTWTVASSFLYRRIVKGISGSTGTLSELTGTPEPRFALQSTVNWMHALALIVQYDEIAWTSMQAFYATVQKATLTEPAINTVFEQLLMSLHHLAALRAMAKAESDCDLARVAIMAWYYGIYCGGSAMIAAQTGTLQEVHMATANLWDQQIAAANWIPRPFSFRLKTLVKVRSEAELDAIRAGSIFSVNNRPASLQDALGACASYLSGTRTYREWQITEEMKGRELKKQNLGDFRTKKAQVLRDDRLATKSLGFMHQAFRYRGKANYRDALFLTYEPQIGTTLDGFIADAESVLKAFVTAAGAFCAQRLRKTDWLAFNDDLASHLRLAVMPSEVWS